MIGLCAWDSFTLCSVLLSIWLVWDFKLDRLFDNVESCHYVNPFINIDGNKKRVNNLICSFSDLNKGTSLLSKWLYFAPWIFRLFALFLWFLNFDLDRLVDDVESRPFVNPSGKHRRRTNSDGSNFPLFRTQKIRRPFCRNDRFLRSAFLSLFRLFILFLQIFDVFLSLHLLFSLLVLVLANLELEINVNRRGVVVVHNVDQSAFSSSL